MMRQRDAADGERFAYASAQTSVLSLIFQTVDAARPGHLRQPTPVASHGC
jgi:hypothetical protein